MEEMPIGLTRHTIIFVNYDGVLFALKEMPPALANKEFQLLSAIERMRLPSVVPVGVIMTPREHDQTGVLITHYLEHSIPYRSLFMRGGMESIREALLDAIASLLVQLHLAGIYWGDCSLSNTLFRRDAGTLQAYLVDVETSSKTRGETPAVIRHQDLDIMEENIDSELTNLANNKMLPDHFPIYHTGAYIRLRYRALWEEITQELIIAPDESFRIQERIRALNALGFSVGGVDFSRIGSSGSIRLKVVVTDRNFHRDQLFNLTGLEVEEKQARQMMNEIQELRAALSEANNRNTPLDVAAFQWRTSIYEPTIQHLQTLIKPDMNLAELYVQVLEHKWYLSERAQKNIGHAAALEDYLRFRKFERTAE
jgi:tRNA A-37 threonylcarbamoyl transferase component Bud32